MIDKINWDLESRTCFFFWLEKSEALAFRFWLIYSSVEYYKKQKCIIV